MKKQDLNFTLDDVINCNPRIVSGVDFWKTSADGVPHQVSSGYNGEKWTVKLPDNIPLKYKGRRFTSAIVNLNCFEFVDEIEVHYGGPSCGGFAIRFTDPDSEAFEDVTSFYKAR